MHNEKYFRKLIQTALQDNTWHEHDRLCDLDWLLYRIRLGGNAIRIMANLDCLFRSTESVSKEAYMKLMDKYITPTNEERDNLLDKMDENKKT